MENLGSFTDAWKILKLGLLFQVREKSGNKKVRERTNVKNSNNKLFTI